jgi:hypothetical protein
VCGRLETQKVESSWDKNCNYGGTLSLSSLTLIFQNLTNGIPGIIQLPHLPTPTIPRGGANTSDHVDILGSTGLNELILRVAAGDGDNIQDTYVSNIRDYVKKMQWD